MDRYIVKADGIEVKWFFDENKAWKFANTYAYECANQDDPYFPVMTVEKDSTQ